MAGILVLISSCTSSWLADLVESLLIKGVSSSEQQTAFCELAGSICSCRGGVSSQKYFAPDAKFVQLPWSLLRLRMLRSGATAASRSLLVGERQLCVQGRVPWGT